MNIRRVSWVFACMAATIVATAYAGDHGVSVEPGAGNWKTWVISSGRDFRVPPPPNAADTQAELRTLEDLIAQNDATVQQQIAYWNAGSPAYRWMNLLNGRFIAGAPMPIAHRIYLYVSLAMYDATIATWDSKYFYNRRRPSEVRHTLSTALPVPNSPSYPSEHAASAWAAAEVLAALLPAEASSFRSMAEEAGWSRVRAGVQYPSDYYAGKALGQAVAAEVIAKANNDNSNVIWTGTVPTGPCVWRPNLDSSGNIIPPGNVAATMWKPLLLTFAGQFRPPAPPSCDTPEAFAEKEAVRTYVRTFTSNYKAYYWQSPEGLQVWPYRYADQWMFEDGLDQNPPRAARVYALVSAVQWDAFIASQDGKFTYWYLRPHMFDPAIVPLFAVPYFPSYPSNHSTFSAARSEMLAYLFPTRADFVRALGKEAGDSRIWAGLHYPMDNAAGVSLGKSVASLFISWAQNDGSQ